MGGLDDTQYNIRYMYIQIVYRYTHLPIESIISFNICQHIHIAGIVFWKPQDCTYPNQRTHSTPIHDDTYYTNFGCYISSYKWSQSVYIMLYDDYLIVTILTILVSINNVTIFFLPTIYERSMFTILMYFLSNCVLKLMRKCQNLPISLNSYTNILLDFFD